MTKRVTEPPVEIAEAAHGPNMTEAGYEATVPGIGREQRVETLESGEQVIVDAPAPKKKSRARKRGRG